MLLLNKSLPAVVADMLPSSKSHIISTPLTGIDESINSKLPLDSLMIRYALFHPAFNDKFKISEKPGIENELVAVTFLSA